MNTRPETGGRFIRDRITGALTAEADVIPQTGALPEIDPAETPPAAAPETETAPASNRRSKRI